MKFTKKTRMYEVNDRYYCDEKYVVFRYTGQKIVKKHAFSGGWESFLEFFDQIVYDPSKKTVVNAYGKSSEMLCKNRPLKLEEIP